MHAKLPSFNIKINEKSLRIHKENQSYLKNLKMKNARKISEGRTASTKIDTEARIEMIYLYNELKLST